MTRRPHPSPYFLLVTTEETGRDRGSRADAPRQDVADHRPADHAAGRWGRGRGLGESANAPSGPLPGTAASLADDTLGKDLPDPATATPSEVAAFFATLTGAQRERLVEDHPTVVGNLDGAPVKLRYEANAPAGDHVLVYDPRGRGLIAWVAGDLENADHVAVIVPGSDIDVSTFDRTAERAADLQEETGDDTAVIAWAGYTTPSGVGLDLATGRLAEAGAERLTRFTEGLNAAGLPDPSLFCHSYGSVVCGLAADDTDASDIVVMGSPGMRADSVDALGTRCARLGREVPGRLDRPRPQRRVPGPGPRRRPHLARLRREWPARRRRPGARRVLHARHLHPDRVRGDRRRRPVMKTLKTVTAKSLRTVRALKTLKAPTKLGAKIDDRTPAHRDRAIDGLRALALLAVPTGHWLVGGFTLDTGGGLHNASPLVTFDALAPASWLLQMMGIFFLVGGYSSYLSYRRRKGSVREWITGRLTRLGRPVLGATAVCALLLPALHYGFGVPSPPCTPRRPWSSSRCGSSASTP